MQPFQTRPLLTQLSQTRIYLPRLQHAARLQSCLGPESSITERGRRGGTLAGLAMIIAALLPLLLMGCADDPPETEPEERPVRLMQLGDPAEQATSRFSGRAAPVRRSVLAFNVPGEIANVSVDLGAKVEAGDELARLDDYDYRLQVQELEYQLESAEAAVDEAEAHYERGEELYAADVISSSEFDSLESAYRQARASRDAVAEGLRQARSALDDTVLEAPFSGVVARRHIEPYQNVSPEIPAIVLDDISEIEVEVGVPESFVARRDQITAVSIEFEALGRPAVAAAIEAVGTDVDATTQAYPVRVRVPNPEAEILPGMTAEVTFTRRPLPEMPDHDALAERTYADEREPTYVDERTYVVPLTALFERDDAVYVWQWDPDTGTVSYSAVTPVGFKGENVRIGNNLRPGDFIVVSGVEYLQDGQSVSPYNASDFQASDLRSGDE